MVYEFRLVSKNGYAVFGLSTRVRDHILEHLYPNVRRHLERWVIDSAERLRAGVPSH